MEPAVSTVLAGVFSQVAAWDDLGDLRVLQGVQARQKPVLWLAPVLTAGGIAGSRRQRDRPIYGKTGHPVLIRKSKNQNLIKKGANHNGIK